MKQNKEKWRRINTPTVTFDRPILEQIAGRVFLRTREHILDLWVKGDKVKIRGYRHYDIKLAFKEKKVFQKIVDKEEFKNKISEYVENTLLDERWW